MFLNDPNTFPDFTIYIGDKKYISHKCFLSQIPYFKTLLNSSFYESKEGYIELNEISPQALDHLLHFLYNEPYILKIEFLSGAFHLADIWLYEQYKDYLVKTSITNIKDVEFIYNIFSEYSPKDLDKYLRNIWKQMKNNIDLSPDLTKSIIEVCDFNDPNALLLILEAFTNDKINEEEFKIYFEKVEITSQHFSLENLEKIKEYRRKLQYPYLDVRFTDLLTNLPISPLCHDSNCSQHSSYVSLVRTCFSHTNHKLKEDYCITIPFLY